MIRYIIFFLLLLYPSLSFGEAGKISLGINISHGSEYSGDIAFIDRMKQSGNWRDYTSPNVTFRPDGYPTKVSSTDQTEWMNKFLFQIPPDIESIVPVGEYTVTWKGTGTINVRNPVTCSGGPCVLTGTNGVHKVTVPASPGLVQFRLEWSDENDPIHEIHFILPGFETNFTADYTDPNYAPFHPDFLAGLQEFSFIRAMDAARTNHTDDIIEWSHRHTTLSASYTSEKSDRGVNLELGGWAWEDIIILANTLDKDLWINIPHKASDGYVSSLVALINQLLEPERHLYVEYSNEMWNSIFDQEDYAALMGRDLCDDGFLNSSGGSLDVTLADAYWVAYRSSQVWDIFDANLTGGRTYTKVLGGQTVVPYRLDSSLKFLAGNHSSCNTTYTTSQRPNGLAVAYYFGVGVVDNILTRDNTVAKSAVTVQDVADLLTSESGQTNMITRGQDTIDDRLQGFIDHVNLAKQYNARVVGYEGGQSYYIGQGYLSEVKSATTLPVKNVNNDPRIKDLYEEFMGVFYSNGGKEFAHFAYISYPQASGSWGLYEYQGDTTDLYKLYGLRNIISRITNGEFNQLYVPVPSDWVRTQ